MILERKLSEQRVAPAWWSLNLEHFLSLRNRVFQDFANHAPARRDACRHLSPAMAAANRVFSLSDTFLASRQMSVRPGDTWFVPARLWPTEKANSTPHGRGWIAHVQSVQRLAARGDAVTFLCEGETPFGQLTALNEEFGRVVRGGHKMNVPLGKCVGHRTEQRIVFAIFSLIRPARAGEVGKKVPNSSPVGQMTEPNPWAVKQGLVKFSGHGCPMDSMFFKVAESGS